MSGRKASVAISVASSRVARPNPSQVRISRWGCVCSPMRSKGSPPGMAGCVIDGTKVAGAGRGPAVADLCDPLEEIDADGSYGAIEVLRPWSRHNPRIPGEFARPRAIRRYLERELRALLELGATITVQPQPPT